jgi:CheY-like chemotaxis protein
MHSTRLRVLVVEDDTDTADSLQQLLDLWGHDAAIAHDGPSALAAAQAHSPDVVLLDLGLPGMNGWELATKIKEGARSKRPFLVAVTGHANVADRQNSHEAGLDLHLMKPVDPLILQQLLERFGIVLQAPQVP